jgi:transcriptional regulator with XRE-family HTH domain
MVCPMLQDHVTAEIRAELGRQDLTQAALAKAMGWTPQRLNRRMKGRAPWSVADVEFIASILDVPRSQLLDSISPRQRRAS